METQGSSRGCWQLRPRSYSEKLRMGSLPTHTVVGHSNTTNPVLDPYPIFAFDAESDMHDETISGK
jgi:hypothetical protein